MTDLALAFESGDVSLSVRRFAVREAVSSLFSAKVVAASRDPSLDLAAIVGAGAAFRAGSRVWSGVVADASLVRAHPAGESTYEIHLAPSLWLLSHRRGYRIFQQLAVPDIVDRLLAEWQIEPSWEVDRAAYPKLDYKVQYGESDLGFFARLLAEAGIAFTFAGEEASRLVLSDRLEEGELRKDPLAIVESTGRHLDRDWVRAVHLAEEVRPGAFVLRDHDLRKPAFALIGEAEPAADPERRYEIFEYRPGAFLIDTDGASDTPVADDRAVARHDADFGQRSAQRALEAERTGRRAVSFETNALDLRPGSVIAIEGHPHPEIGDDSRLLVVEAALSGAPESGVLSLAQAVFADMPYRPPRDVTRPRAMGVACATVVGPPGEEIHTDELGRVRVQFPWDREGRADDRSSCWIRVSQGMGGTGFGLVNIPRVGQEVLVTFADGDPEQPVIVGRVFNAQNPTAYKLPEQATASGWRSASTPGGEGFNEIRLDDTKGEESLSIQAERDMRKLVNEDETTTTQGAVAKQVLVNELDTTLGNRFEVTLGARAEVMGGGRAVAIGGNSGSLTLGDAAGLVAGGRKALVGGAQSTTVRGSQREGVTGNANAIVRGDRMARVAGDASSIAGGARDDEIGGRLAIDAGGRMSMTATARAIGEGSDVTLSASGSFVRIDAGGVTISGPMVKLNAGGSARAARAAKPALPDAAKEPEVATSLPGVSLPGLTGGPGTPGSPGSADAPGDPGSPDAPLVPGVPGSTAVQPSPYGVPAGGLDCRGNMLVHQEKGMSCACATSRMLIHSKTGQNIPEAQLRDESAARPPGGYDEFNGTSITDVKCMLNDHGANGSGTWRGASVASMEAALAQGRPAALLLRNVGHFVVLDGIETRPDGTQVLLLRDPAYRGMAGCREIVVGGDEWNNRIACGGMVLNIPG